MVPSGQTRVIDIETVRRLRISLVGGQIDVIGHDDPGTRVEVHSVRGRDLRITLDGDSLEVDHMRLGWSSLMDIARFLGPDTARARISILVPRHTALNLGTVTADVLASGLIGSARINTVSGEIQVESHRGDVAARAVSGEIGVSDHHGPLHTQTVSGEITASGAISPFDSETASGKTFLDITGPAGHIATKTVSGHSTVRVDGDLGVHYALNSVSGKVSIDGQVGDLRTGQLPGGGETVEITANSVSGSLTILRRGTADAS